MKISGRYTKRIIDDYTCYALACLFMISLLISCGNTTQIESVDICADYPDWQTSLYILPYLAGTSFEVIQGNCMPKGKGWMHFGNMRYAYDFGMPIGTPILASRSGMVVFVREQFTDNDHAQEQGNALVILHDDGTVALYGHMTYHGVLVAVGDRVAQGDRVALSGNSGESPVPHLHFQVDACSDFDACETVPISFRNTVPHMGRLIHGASYEAGKD
jgi:hypothetical protein